MKEECCSDCNCGKIPKNKMCQQAQPAHKFDVNKIKQLTSDPKFICKCCGRTANKKDNLCSPTPLK